ncbi:hypothetical protein [Algiphilus sp.]|uniref:hypothetical protein n=1 Tax=Algiphilus sp. TaxID=1872431 RepID=UPI002A69655B|nr:hypothetical protein [Pseudomonadota bacterium]
MLHGVISSDLDVVVRTGKHANIAAPALVQPCCCGNTVSGSNPYAKAQNGDLVRTNFHFFNSLQNPVASKARSQADLALGHRIDKVAVGGTSC